MTAGYPERFRSWMTALDGELLEEAMCSVGRAARAAEPRRSVRVVTALKRAAAAAACLCVALGLLLWKSPAPPEARPAGEEVVEIGEQPVPGAAFPELPALTAEDLAGYGYRLPVPEDAGDVRYDLIERGGAQPAAQAEFTRGGSLVTLRALKVETPGDIFDEDREWTDCLEWTADGVGLLLCSGADAAQVSWYSGGTQWAVRGELPPDRLLDTVRELFSGLGLRYTAPPG